MLSATITESVVKVLIIILAVLVGIFLLSIITGIDGCLTAYRNKLIDETVEIKHNHIASKDEHTKIIREMIREDVMTEVDIYIHKKELANEKIVMLNLDKDINEIANSIHEGYATALADPTYFNCSPDHIRKEIINCTTILLSSRAVAYNQSLNKE